MASTIITKNSSTASATPAVGDLQQGELAVNVTDKKVYTKDSSAAIVKLVGSLGNQEASAVAITGGSIAGITDLAVADGGTGSSTAAGARSNLSAAASGANSDITSLSGLTTALSVAQGGTGVTSSTGSGSVVLSNSPTLVTPALGTPSAAVLTNATGLPLSTGISGLGTGVATFLGTPSSANLLAAVTDETGTGALVFANSPTLVTPALGTPASATLTNATGLPIGTGVSGLGTGVATALAVNVGSAGAPVVNGGVLGTPSSATLTNATGLPISTGVSGLGTGVATALAVNVGSAGAPVVNGGALGTPSSGTVTNLTGTASININGTVGATTPTTGAFTTLAASSSVTLSGGTANGVTYLNGSKVLTSGSALTFDGTNLGVGTASPGQKLEVYGTMRVRSATEILDISAPSGKIDFNNLAGDPLSFSIGSSEQMRLTSTGLGIGTSSPATKLEVAGDVRLTGANPSLQAIPTSSGFFIDNRGVGKPTIFRVSSASAIDTTAATLDSSGNLGLGVTPSTWSGLKGFQVGRATLGGYASEGAWLSSNAFYDGANWVYLTTAQATQYRQLSGVQSWHVAGSGTAGTAISFSQAMTLDASGNLGVGTSSPSYRLHAALNGVTGPKLKLENTNATSNNAEVIFAGPGSSTVGQIYTDGAGSGGFDLNINAPTTNGFIRFGTGVSGTERARIDSSGNLLVGQTSASVTTAGAAIQATQGAGKWAINVAGASSASTDYAYYAYSTSAAAYRFLVSYSGTISATNTTISGISDIRFKENIRDLDDGLDVVMALKPRKFDWKNGKGRDIKNDRGFIAQEFETVLPDMIEPWADKAPEGEEPYKAINANLIPTLVKAIQELKAEFDAYKASHP